MATVRGGARVEGRLDESSAYHRRRRSKMEGVFVEVRSNPLQVVAVPTKIMHQGSHMLRA
jgi:hypothetical protein